MRIYLLASGPGGRIRRVSDPSWRHLIERVQTDHDYALDGIAESRLDLLAIGQAFVDITKTKALPFGLKFSKRDAVDLMVLSRGQEYLPGKGYTRGEFELVRGWLEVCGGEQRTMTLQV